MGYDLREHIKTLYHTGFIVRDIDRTLDFYIRQLGFTLYNHWTEPVEEVENGMCVPGASLELAQVEGYGCKLEFIRFRTSPGSEKKLEPNQIGLGHICLLVSDLNGVMKNLQERGVEFCSAPVVLKSGAWVQFADPDGIRIEIMEFYKK